MTTNPTDAQMKLAREWECFQDAAYYDMYCVRLEGDRTFGNGFHLSNKDEAFGLRDLLNTHQATEARAQGLVDALEEIGRKSDEPTTVEFLVSQALATWRRT